MKKLRESKARRYVLSTGIFFKNGSDHPPIPLFADITQEECWRTMEWLRKEGLTDVEIVRGRFYRASPVSAV